MLLLLEGWGLQARQGRGICIELAWIDVGHTGYMEEKQGRGSTVGIEG